MINFLLAVIILLFTAKLFGEIFEYLKLPSLLGEFLAGIILGGTFLNLISAEQIESLALIGVILLLFLIGFNFKIEHLKKEGMRGSIITIVGYIFVVGFLYFTFKYLDIGYGFMHAVLFGIAVTGESTANVIRTLWGLKRFQSNVSEIIIGATIVEDFILYTILAISISIASSQNIVDVELSFGKIAIFFSVFVIMERIAPLIIRYSEKMRSEEAQFALSFILILLLAYLAQILGFAAIVGAFFAGIALAYSPYLKTGSFSPKIASFTYGIFVPLFFGWIGLQLVISSESFSLMGIGIVAGALAVKFVGNFIGAFILKAGFMDSLGSAIGLVNIGGDQLLVIIILSNLGIFGDFLTVTLLPSVVIVMVLSMFIGPGLLKLFFKIYPEESNK